MYLDYLKDLKNRLKNQIINPYRDLFFTYAITLLKNLGLLDKFISVKNRFPKQKLLKYFKTGLKIVVSFYIILCLLSLYDINRHKDTIQSFLNEKTDNKVLLNGAIKLRVLSGIGIEATDVALKKKATSKNNLITAEKIYIKPSLLNLLIGRKIFKIELSAVKWKTTHFPFLKTKIKISDKIVELSNSAFEIQKGNEKGLVAIDSIIIDLKNEHPKYFLKHRSNQFPLELIFKTLDPKIKLAGDSIVDIEMTAEGTTPQHIKKTLTGKLMLEVNKGKIYGMDMVATLKEAKSLFDSITSKLSQTLAAGFDTIFHRHRYKKDGVTHFNTLKLITTIHTGIVKIEEVYIHHPHFKIDATGSLNLALDTLNCDIIAFYKEHGIIHHENGKSSLKLAPLLVKITGKMEDPKIRPDIPSYLNYLHQQDEDPKKKSILKSIKKLIPSL